MKRRRRLAHQPASLAESGHRRGEAVIGCRARATDPSSMPVSTAPSPVVDVASSRRYRNCNEWGRCVSSYRNPGQRRAVSRHRKPPPEQWTSHLSIPIVTKKRPVQRLPPADQKTRWIVADAACSGGVSSRTR